jgi:hypothetical protein
VILDLKNTGASPRFRTSGQLEGSNGKLTAPFQLLQLHEGSDDSPTDFLVISPAGHHSNAMSNNASGRSLMKRPPSTSQIVFCILESSSAGKLEFPDTWFVISLLYLWKASNQPSSSLKSSFRNGRLSSPVAELIEADLALLRCLIHFPGDFEEMERNEREVELLRDLDGSRGDSHPAELPVDGR